MVVKLRGSAIYRVAKAGASRVIACDSDNHALEAIKINAELNRVSIKTARSLIGLVGKVDMIMVSDLLYDSDNLAFLDIFFNHTDEVLLADSRVKNFQHPRYQQITTIKAETIPDLKEAEEYNHVTVYNGL